MKIFEKWETDDIKVNDPGLDKYINIKSSIAPRSGGIHATHQFHRAKVNIVERLMNKLMVPGHRGKKHIIGSGKNVGKKFTVYRIVKKTFEKIEGQVKKNPVEVFIRAIENSALREEITAYQIGGMMVRRAVITSPQRRIDKSLSIIAHTAFKKSFGKKETIVDSLANEIIGAYNNDAGKSEAVKEKERIEREAEGAR